MVTSDFDEQVKRAYEFAAEVLPEWYKLQSDVSHSMLYNRAVHGPEFMAEVKGRYMTGVTMGRWMADNIEFLSNIAMDDDKDCPAPLIGRILDIIEQIDALSAIPPLTGSIVERIELIDKVQREVDGTNPTEVYQVAEETILEVLNMVVPDIFKMADMDWVPMPEPEFHYPNGKYEDEPKGEFVTCDDCVGSDCLFNEANANNPAIWVCLAQEIARDRADNVQNYVIEIEGYGDGFRLVETWSGCGGEHRNVIVSAHTAEEFHSELVRFLVGTVDEVKTETPGFAKEPQPA